MKLSSVKMITLALVAGVLALVGGSAEAAPHGHGSSGSGHHSAPAARPSTPRHVAPTPIHRPTVSPANHPGSRPAMRTAPAPTARSPRQVAAGSGFKKVQVNANLKNRSAVQPTRRTGNVQVRAKPVAGKGQVAVGKKHGQHKHKGFSHHTTVVLAGMLPYCSAGVKACLLTAMEGECLTDDQRTCLTSAMQDCTDPEQRACLATVLDEDLAMKTADEQDEATDLGLQINQVLDDSAAADGGLRVDDIIVRIDGVNVYDIPGLRANVAGKSQVEVVFINSENGQLESVQLSPKEGLLGVGGDTVELSE